MTYSYGSKEFWPQAVQGRCHCRKKLCSKRQKVYFLFQHFSYSLNKWHMGLQLIKPVFLNFLQIRINKKSSKESRVFVNISNILSWIIINNNIVVIMMFQSNWNSWWKFPRFLICCFSSAVIKFSSAPNNFHISKPSSSSSSSKQHQQQHLGIGNSRLVPSSWMLVWPSCIWSICVSSTRSCEFIY